MKITQSYAVDEEVKNYIQEQAEKKERSCSWILNNIVKKEMNK